MKQNQATKPFCLDSRFKFRSTHRGNSDAKLALGINYVQTATEQETSLLLCNSALIGIGRRAVSST